MTTTIPGRWAIWTNGGATSTSFRAEPATSVYRLADGTYLTVETDGAQVVREVSSPDRPTTPEGHPIPLQWSRLEVRLAAGPATDALVADLEANGGRPDPDLLWRLVTAVGGHPDAPALLFATGVRVECQPRRSTGVGLRVTYYL